MRIVFLDCFPPDDPTGKLLTGGLTKAAADDSNLELIRLSASNAGNLKNFLVDQIAENPDIIIIAGHGHKSPSGVDVGTGSLVWHDAALLLRGKLAPDCTVIFYSCNGDFTELRDIFDPEKPGPDFVFGPLKKIDATIMSNAVIEIIARKKVGCLSRASAIEIVDACNRPDGKALGVMWSTRTQIKQTY